MIGFIEVPQGIHKERIPEMLGAGRPVAEQYKFVLTLLIGKVQEKQKGPYQTPVTNSLSSQTGTKIIKQTRLRLACIQG